MQEQVEIYNFDKHQSTSQLLKSPFKEYKGEADGVHG